MEPKSFADPYREAEQHDDYWVAGLVHDFTEALSRRMEEQGVSRAELARRLDTSQAYVTKVLRGNVNFTRATLWCRPFSTTRTAASRLYTTGTARTRRSGRR